MVNKTAKELTEYLTLEMSAEEAIEFDRRTKEVDGFYEQCETAINNMIFDGTLFSYLEVFNSIIPLSSPFTEDLNPYTSREQTQKDKAGMFERRLSSLVDDIHGKREAPPFVKMTKEEAQAEIELRLLVRPQYELSCDLLEMKLFIEDQHKNSINFYSIMTEKEFRLQAYFLMQMIEKISDNILYQDFSASGDPESGINPDAIMLRDLLIKDNIKLRKLYENRLADRQKFVSSILEESKSEPDPEGLFLSSSEEKNNQSDFFVDDQNEIQRQQPPDELTP